MSAMLDQLLTPTQLADCERTDCVVSQKSTLKLGDQAVPLDSLNHDDIYIIHLRDRRIVERFGASGLHAQTIKGGGSWWVPLGCAVLTGMQAQVVLA